MYNTSEKMKKRGLDSKGMSKIIHQLIKTLKISDIPEILPEYLITQYRLPSRYEAYCNIHLPSKPGDQSNAERRLKFEELFIQQLRMIKLQLSRKREKGHIFETIGPLFNELYEKHLPFSLTNAQKKVLKEIRKDTLSGYQMNRLLQGDVGSGKTIVSVLTSLFAIDNGFQATIMAPTEILAQQHFEGVSSLLKPLPIKVAILTGSVKGKARKEILAQLESGEIHLLIGTHALIEDHVSFKNLGMVVIDEQHRFGVEQRSKLWRKSETSPHVLVMTATPIPRSLALVFYGDLDHSILDELPPGRKPIQTIHRTEASRLRVFGFMKEQIALGRQIYIVYPLIQESEKLDLLSLMEGYESICSAFPMPQYQVSIVHGKLKPAVKEFEMQRFVRGETHIMVATTVIEVGVNVPNASVMIIENAERFGLSQLHQLRGRVGRGADQSFCILMSSDKLSRESRIRIRTMCDTNDGFKIAEADLELRGPGDVEGTRQSGDIFLKIANITTDKAILEEARSAALKILEIDSSLQQIEHQSLHRYLKSLNTNNSFWSKIL
jgi:ATP-dependent DNA helicase RecG